MTSKTDEIQLQELYAGALYKAKLGRTVIKLTDKSYCKEQYQYLSKNKRSMVAVS
jgi:hypothetical protein